MKDIRRLNGRREGTEKRDKDTCREHEFKPQKRKKKVVDEIC